jgi:hypothetical protein
MKRLGMMAVVGAAVALWLLPAASSAAELSGGLKIGLNVATIHGADTDYFSGVHFDDWFLRFGFCGGGFITINLSKIVALQAEALMTTKGSKEAPVLWEDYPTYRYSFNTSYLDIPLLIKLMAPPFGNTDLGRSPALQTGQLQPGTGAYFRTKTTTSLSVRSSCRS